eukprot:CAMPEP_0116576296 /NCGR_PEP_ID=MMETSP0397-20121206/20453_1 /TAXON_ID=216820 /ORGANISM="Cyclophora tenuis, Strain ECT3854" /LENGTH=223 /DNA_ID=CAMNT_0004105321 /DNA_START=20 /DNA_END=691 /DNA_ORIENTATION=+
MKITLAFSLVAVTSAFAPASFGIRSRTYLFSDPEATTDALVDEAVEASETFGATSTEAQLAWEAVDDMDVKREQSEAYTGGVSPDECDAVEPSQECLDYGEKMDQLAELLKVHGPKIAEVKKVAEELQAIKLMSPDVKPGEDSPELRAALENAKAMSKEFGSTSPEAKVAWAELEEIASASNSNAMGVRLDEECLIEAIEGCAAIEEVQRYVNLGKSTSRYSG